MPPLARTGTIPRRCRPNSLVENLLLLALAPPPSVLRSLMIPAFRPLFLLLASLLIATNLCAQGTIKIGEFASLTGKEATYGQTVHKGTQFAIEEINAAGGLLGKQLELIVEDNQSKAGESATIAKKLISRDKVVA